MSESVNPLSSQARRAKNELLFRKANQEVFSLLRRVFGGDKSLHLMCECSSLTCWEPLTLSTSELNSSRKNEYRFVILPKHEQTDVETVIKKREHYYVVEKKHHLQDA